MIQGPNPLAHEAPPWLHILFPQELLKILMWQQNLWGWDPGIGIFSFPVILDEQQPLPRDGVSEASP